MIPAVRRRQYLALAALLALGACNSDDPEAALEAIPEEGEVVTPPFAVRGEADDLLLVWFDAEGPHTAARRSDIPEARRAQVRVEDLGAADPLDPSLVYVADLSAPGPGGDFPVRRMTRDAFEAAVEAAQAGPAEELAAGESEGAAGADVVIYGASWCSACRGAAAYLRQRHVPFVERDIEREPGAREAMMQAAQRAGIRPSGIPVIDFRGQVIAGFDRGALERAIERDRTTI